jgi:uncharacterized damage-inducible protein DinB
MRMLRLLCAVLVTLPVVAAENDSKAIFAKHWQVAKEFKFQGQPVLAREALWYTFTHMAHHRGQAEVYLRVTNIKPPAWRF